MKGISEGIIFISNALEFPKINKILNVPYQIHWVNYYHEWFSVVKLINLILSTDMLQYILMSDVLFKWREKRTNNKNLLQI